MLVRVLLVHFKCTASSTFSNSTFCPHRMRLCVVCWSENSNHFPIQHSLGGFYNRDGQCLLRGTDWLLNSYKSVDPGLPWEIKVNIWSAYCTDRRPRSPKGGRGRQTCQKGAMSIYWVVPNWHFLITLTEVLSVLCPSVVRRMPGYNPQRRGLTLDMTNNMPPQKAYCILTNGPQFAHVEVFNHDGKLVSVNATPFTVCQWAQRCGKRRYD